MPVLACWASDTEVLNPLLIPRQHPILVSLCFGGQVGGPGGPREDSPEFPSGLVGLGANL